MHSTRSLFEVAMVQDFRAFHEIKFAVTLVDINHLDGVVQERCNSIANAVELRLSCNNPSICQHDPDTTIRYLEI